MTKSKKFQEKHNDIIEDGWWRNLPTALHPFIYLGRFDRPIGWWLLLLPGWWVIPIGASSAAEMFLLMFLFFSGAIITRAAGCIINDLWDCQIDQKVERTRKRPLASGTVSVFTAIGCLIFLGLFGIVILFQLPITAIYVGLASAPLVVLYPLAKRVTWFPQFILGLTFSWGVPLGWTATTGNLPDLGIIVIYAGTVAWVFGYDTIYAVQDMTDDIIVGVKSSALAFGNHLKHAVGAAYGVAILLLSLGLYIKLGIGIWLGGLSLMALQLAHQLRQLNSRDPELALKLFQSNRNAGLILMLALVLTSLLG